jgi:hypothetical protein
VGSGTAVTHPERSAGSLQDVNNATGDVDRRGVPGPRAWTGLVLAAGVVVLAGVGFVAMAVGTIGGPDLTAGDRIAPIPLSLFAAVGGLLAFRRPGNPIGWLLIAFALLQVAGGTSPLIAYSDRVPGAVSRAANWFGSWSWVPSIAGLGLVIVWFPDGRLPSRRWRPVMALLLAGIAGGCLLGGLLWSHRSEDLLAVGDQWPGAAGTVAFPVLMATVLGFVGALAAAVVRSRRGDAVTRLQMKWLLFGAALLAGALVIAAIAEGPYGGGMPQWISDALGMTGLTAVPIAIAIAVLRYRLYEIDRVIGRTVTYLIVVAVLAGTYAAAVIVLQGTLRPWTVESDLVVAGSTLLVAALFGPLLRRVRGMVDRRFNRAHVDAQAQIERLSVRLREELDTPTITADLLGTVRGTLQPATCGLWLTASRRGPPPPPAWSDPGAAPSRDASSRS